MRSWFARVPSHSNPADGASRLDDKELTSLGAPRTTFEWESVRVLGQKEGLRETFVCRCLSTFSLITYAPYLICIFFIYALFLRIANFRLMNAGFISLFFTSVSILTNDKPKPNHNLHPTTCIPRSPFFCNGKPHKGDAACQPCQLQAAEPQPPNGTWANQKIYNSQGWEGGTNCKQLQLPQAQPSSCCLEPSST